MIPTVPRARVIRRSVVRGVLGLTGIGLTLFGFAQRLDWPAAWALMILFAVYLAAGLVWFARHDPDLLHERMTRAANVPWWDRVLVRLYILGLTGLLATAALDAGRARWSRMPIAWQATGAAAMCAAFAAIWWCTTTNHYLSGHARLQADRGQRVVRDGPYRFVRHPMYTSLIVLMFAMALLLGSWLALVPAGLIAVIFIVRTSLEDRMLADGLPGYREYAQQVRQRLVPHIW